jgi:serine/threonine protein kinase
MMMSTAIKTKATGTVVIDFAALTAVCAEQGKWVETVLSQTGLDRRTIEHIRQGVPIRRVTLEQLLPHIGPQNLGRILRHKSGASSQDEEDGRKGAGNKLGNWTDAKALTPWITTPNGLQYQVSKVRHQHLTDTFARAKCYELKFLTDDQRVRLQEHLERHPKVCRMLAPSPRISINEDAFPDSDGNWWVIDYWIDGTSLGDALASERLPLSEAIRIGRELAEGLKLLHDNGIVRRELNPKHVLLRAPDRSVVLTDFELAKLLSGAPTVAKDWPADPYRAPELGEAEAGPSVDIYSWGRIMTYMTIGVLPAAGDEKKALHGQNFPDLLIDLLSSCVAGSPGRRPRAMQQVMDALTQ